MKDSSMLCNPQSLMRKGLYHTVSVEFDDGRLSNWFLRSKGGSLNDFIDEPIQSSINLESI